MYSHGGFERSSGCTLQFPSTELFPLPNFQKRDCRCRWAYSLGIGEVWWMCQTVKWSCHDWIIYTIHPTFPILNMTAQPKLWQSFTETNKPQKAPGRIRKHNEGWGRVRMLGLHDKCIYLSTQPALPAQPALPPRVAESKEPRNPVPNFFAPIQSTQWR